MSFNLESRKGNEINKTPEVKVDSEQLPETEETAENFDDCSLNEVQDSKGNEVNAESLEDAEENYDDCEAKLEEMEEKNPESAEEDDDFSDCGKETDDQYAAEAAYTTDGKINKQKNEAFEGTETIDNKIPEAAEKTEGSGEVDENAVDTEPNENKKLGADDLEKMDDASRVETHEIDEDTLSEDISEKVEEDTNTELSDETKERISEEVSDEMAAKAENNKISVADAEEIVEEKKEKITDSVEEQSESMDDEIEQKAEQIAEDDNLTDTEAKEQISEEVSESVNEELSDEDTEAMVGEKSETIEETVEEKAEEQETFDAVEETADELEKEKAEQFAEQTRRPLQERIDNALEKEDITVAELGSLRNEQLAELREKIEEKNNIEAALKTKFNEALSKDRDSADYRQTLQEHNNLQDKKAELDVQIAEMEERRNLLHKKSSELRDAQIQKGSNAVAASAAALARFDTLQERYDQTFYAKKINKKELGSIRDDSSVTIKELSVEEASIKRALEAKMDEISEYVISNNMDKYDTAHDSWYQQMRAEYTAMEEKHSRIRYAIVKLDENNKLIDERIEKDIPKSIETPGRTFGSYEVDKYGFVKGDNYKQYIEDWENYSPEFHKVEDKAEVRMIAPSSVEGIHVNEYDIDNPSVFWGSERGKTEKTFEEIARHIPEVQSRLNAGENLNDLMEDAEVGACAAIYFHPNNMPRVIKCGDYYAFQGNGRHRILAARNVGYDIPVKVVGERNSLAAETHNESKFNAFFAEKADASDIDTYQEDLDEQAENEKNSILKQDAADASEEVCAPPRSIIDSAEYTYITDALQNLKVEYRPLQKAAQERTTQEIITRLSGGDKTKGSCSSLALAYAGNKAGYDVLDFRDGESRLFFSSRSSIQKISEIPNVKSIVFNGRDDVETAKQLMANMQEGKEYYLATGGHAAIVRYVGGEYQYLELQHPSDGNGWHALNEYRLRERFRCKESREVECASFLIDVDTLSSSDEFKNILGFINTAEAKQIKGGDGNVR